MRTRWLCLAAAAVLAVAGCVGTRPPARVAVPPAVRTVDAHILYTPTTWKGDVRVVRPLIVTRNATLTIMPGTRVFFDLPDLAAGAKPEPWLLVQGRLVATGTPEAPITFTSVSLRQNELEDMIEIRGAKEAHLRYCVFERGPWGLHIHDATVDVRSSTFRDGYGGVRFQGGRISLRGNRFENNRIGIRCLNGSPVIEENAFVGNLTGIFFRQGVTGAVVRHNNFDDVEYDLKLGEAQTDDVDAGSNWWAAAAKGRLADRIYDGTDSEGIGRVRTDPVLAEPWGLEPKR